MVNTQVNIDLDEYQEWLEGEESSNENLREFITSLDMYNIGQLVGEYDWSSVEDIYIEKVSASDL